MSSSSYLVGVFVCEVDAVVSQKVVETVFYPVKQRNGSAAAFGVTHARGTTRWFVVAGNSTQVSAHDVRVALATLCRKTLGWDCDRHDPRLRAWLLRSLTSLGEGHHVGSPRAGMPWTAHPSGDDVVTAY